MKLTLKTSRVLELCDALERLDGYRVAVTVGTGQNTHTEVIVVAYDLSPKFKWNAGKNMVKLAAIKAVFDAKRESAAMRLRSVQAAFVPPQDATKEEIEAAYAEHNLKVKASELAEDTALAALGEEQNEVEGLLKLPGDGIKIRARDPGIIRLVGILGDFIEGQPDFGENLSGD